MPRKPRRKSSSGIYHVMIRGINRQTIFEEDGDKIRLLDTISRFKGRCNFNLYGYCLMNNHIHLLMREVDESISLTMQRIGASYVYWYNAKYDRYGPLFQDRFKSETVETLRYFKKVLRYIHQNPLKANLVKNVFESKWTSLTEYLGEPRIVDIDFALHMFSPKRTEAIQQFTKYMTKSNDDQCLDDHIKIRISDDDVRNYLNKLGIPHSSSLQQMDRVRRDSIILQLKQIDGVSIRQLARVTGVSRSVIQRVE